jgi:hypothetical protein
MIPAAMARAGMTGTKICFNNKKVNKKKSYNNN